MSSEHVLIPKERYEKLLSRMLHKEQLSEKKKSDNVGGTHQDVNAESINSPQHEARDDNTSLEGSDFPRAEGANRKAGPEGGRTLEDIQANHAAFLPPGEEPAVRHPSSEGIVRGSPAEKIAKRKVKKMNSEKNFDDKKKHKNVKRAGKPFSVLGKKWVSV